MDKAGGRIVFERILESIEAENGAGGAGVAGSYEGLKAADASWLRLRTMKTGEAAGPAPQVVTRHVGAARHEQQQGEDDDVQKFDVVVCGGTLGVFVATALALHGHSVAILEQRAVQGRAQEWNISRKELQELVSLGVLTPTELQEVTRVQFNPNRCAFHGGEDVWVTDILNLGISPVMLVEKVKQRFVSLGGCLLEHTALHSIQVFDDGAMLSVGRSGGKEAKSMLLMARLVIDAMGNFSPIVRQVRWGQKPDGVCLVVGTCARGFAPAANATSDVICTTAPVARVGASPMQYFWEAFPAGSGERDRTTYMFTYLDARPERPSLEQLLDAYWDLMPLYQGVELKELQVLRCLFGFFPTYRNRQAHLPAYPSINEVQVGDASGIQSPLSFGGFGSITRHLERISSGESLNDALQADLLSKRHLSLVNPYQPNLSGAWLLQRAMSARVHSSPPPHFINDLLSTNFGAMQKLGDPVLRPFLQDVTQFGPLALTMGSMMLARPSLLPTIFAQVGVVPLVDWLGHFVALGAYTVLSRLAAPALRSWVEGLPVEAKFEWRRRLEAWRFGSGLDYHL
eukprot:jgi/Mesen1/1919/ME000144S01047